MLPHRRDREKTMMADRVVPSRARRSGILLLPLLLNSLIFTAMRSGALAFTLRSSRATHSILSNARSVYLPPRGASVSGTVYEADAKEAPTITLFTKEGCTLCDKVKDVLVDVRESYPHSLQQIDITDEQHSDWFDKYKYDIPVLHVNGQYWIKHRITSQEAKDGLNAVLEGKFESPKGEPNAKEMEH